MLEDGISQRLAAFGEGSSAPVRVSEVSVSGGPEATKAELPDTLELPVGESFAGANVFVLFDTSNFMYRSFVYAEDAIADFIRGLDEADSVALYGFSRNLTRHANLTDDRLEAIKGLRRSVAGDETALYNALLLTLRDAAKVSGRKVVIVFSNGPDTASTVGPDDVGAIAEDEGIPIYVISTKDLNKDPISSNAFRRITSRTGGRAYFAKTATAIGSLREHPRRAGQLYTMAYIRSRIRTAVGATSKWRTDGPDLNKYRVRTRNGYRPKI